MNIEEKAKRYDKAIKRSNELLYVSDKESLQYKTIKHILPELIDSEDERIRNFISNELACLRATDEKGSDRYEELTNAITWLEEQGEHANFRNNIKIGDKVTRNEDGVLVNLSQLNRVAKPAEKQVKNNMGISEATKQKLEDNLNKALEKETSESLNEFLDEQGEQKKTPIEGEFPVQPKQEWSEDDEKMIENIIDTINMSIEDCDVDDIGTKARFSLEKERNWLKNKLKYLRPQNTWKPSDEQMDALYTYIYNPQYFNSSDPRMELVESVYKDLKKLKGE